MNVCSQCKQGFTSMTHICPTTSRRSELVHPNESPASATGLPEPCAACLEGDTPDDCDHDTFEEYFNWSRANGTGLFDEEEE